MAHRSVGFIVSCLVVLPLAGCMGPRSLGSGSASPVAADIQQPGLGWIEGSIVDQNFVAIEGASVHIVGTDRQATSDDAGHFRLINLGSGTYTVEVGAMGWQTDRQEARVTTGGGATLTFFLDPLLLADPYHDVKLISGRMTCALATLGPVDTTSLTCTSTRKDLGFPADWAATVTEVTWGPSGLASSSQAAVTLESVDSAGTAHVYARKVTDSPARITLLPDSTYPSLGGDTKTPAAGQEAPLQMDLRRAPTQIVDNVFTVSATVDQTFSIYHTMFYVAAPSDLDAYSALPH